MNTEAIKICPKCQAEIPPGAPQGLCPKCVIGSVSLATEAGPVVEKIPPPSLETVAAVFPHLEILEMIGQGGMGAVYKARQPKLDRFVALKILTQKPGSDPAFGERFNREARVLARLNHPNIVTVHDYGQAGPFFYLLMEFVDGVNLRQAMRAERFSPAQALALVPKICDALQYAHEEGILHRDIKPENLLLDTRGRVKIADFGIAKLVGDAKDITLTVSGARVGTPHYMAPEQLEHPHDVDQRADVYSLGVVFYEMLTGELPIGRFAAPSEKAPVDPRVDQVVLRTLEKERERRFQSAEAVRTQVEEIAATPTVEKKTGGSPSAAMNAGAPPCVPPFQPPAGNRDSATPFFHRWSVKALLAGAFVSFSLLEFLVVLAKGSKLRFGELIMVFVLVGVPAGVGTVLGWRALDRFRTLAPRHRRGERLALLCAIVWPMLVMDLILIAIPLLVLINLQWVLFHDSRSKLADLLVFVEVLVLLGLNLSLFRHLLRRWKTERAMPYSEVLPRLKTLPKKALVAFPVGLFVLLLLLVVGPNLIKHNVQQGEPPSNIVNPAAPDGFDASAGSGPTIDAKEASLSIPAGYALTVTAVICSNQVVLPYESGNACLCLVSAANDGAQGHLSWRLMGNDVFADGAPLQLSLAADGVPSPASSKLNIVPPRPVKVQWVCQPSQIWPPSGGHTRFLLVRGTGKGDGPEGDIEWALGIEVRLDPVPEKMAVNRIAPLVTEGPNWIKTLENLDDKTGKVMFSGEAKGLSDVAFAVVPAEKQLEYKSICQLIDGLTATEKELLVQMNPESTAVKGLRERIAENNKIKIQLETEFPGLAKQVAKKL